MKHTYVIYWFHKAIETRLIEGYFQHFCNNRNYSFWFVGRVIETDSDDVYSKGLVVDSTYTSEENLVDLAEFMYSALRDTQLIQFPPDHWPYEDGDVKSSYIGLPISTQQGTHAESFD